VGRWRQIAVASLVVIILAGSLGAVGRAQNAPLVVRSVLSGQVIALRLATTGQAVKHGDPLVFVQTSTGGAVPAAVAPVDGQVVQVMVGPGDFVHIGDAVVAIAPH